MTTVADGLFQYGGMPVGMGIPPFLSRNAKVFFVDPVNGADGNDGRSPHRAFATLYQLHNKMTSGNNDVGFLIGNGGTTATARLSLALAQTIDSTATTGKLTWSKSACHLIGVAAPGMIATRARIAPPTGTYTQATFGTGDFVEVSGSGCYFSNISLFHGFSTGGTAQICWKNSGGRNVYDNVHFGGMGDAASAQDADSRSLVISGTSGENLFVNCTIGLDTVTRTVANASLEFTGGTPRNVFRGCIFPMYTSSATSLFGLAAAAAAVDRFQLFQQCLFLNAMDSGSTALTGAFTLAASAGGCLVLKDCTLVGDGTANWGSDATSLAQIYVDGAAPTAATSGLAVNPT